MEDKNTSEQLLALLDRLIPLVDSLADKLGALLLVLIALLGWFGFYLFGLQEWSWQTTAFTLLFVLVPLLILARLYWSLRDLQALPDIVDEVGDDLRATWTEVRTGKRGALNVFSQAKNLYEVRGLLGSADDLIGQYVSFGVLINPFFLILAVLALMFTLLLFLVGLGTLIGAVF